MDHTQDAPMEKSAEPTQKSLKSQKSGSIFQTQKTATTSESQETQKNFRNSESHAATQKSQRERSAAAHSTQVSKEDAKPRKIDRESAAKGLGKKTTSSGSGVVEPTQQHSLAPGLSRRRELEHDKTQWENTRFKELHATLQQGIDPNENNVLNKLVGDHRDPIVLRPDPDSIGTNVPGETRQETKERGQHLMDFPTFSVVFDFIELGCLLFALIMTGVGSGMAVFGGYIVIFNIVVCIGLLVFTLYSQWTHRQVDEELTPEGHRVYRTRALYKKLFFFFHIIRMWFSFSSMVILFYHSTCNRISESLEGAGEAAVAATQCREPESSTGFYMTAAFVMLVPIALSIMHLAFICKNQFARKSFK